jgi:hypothetical protein
MLFNISLVVAAFKNVIIQLMLLSPIRPNPIFAISPVIHFERRLWDHHRYRFLLFINLLERQLQQDELVVIAH